MIFLDALYLNEEKDLYNLDIEFCFTKFEPEPSKLVRDLLRTGSIETTEEIFLKSGSSKARK